MPFFPLTISRSVKQRTRSPYVAKRNTGRANTSHPDSVALHPGYWANFIIEGIQRIIAARPVALVLLVLGLMASLAQAADLTEADMVHRLSTPTSAAVKEDNSGGTFSNDSWVPKGALVLPDTNGACLARKGSANEKTLAVIAMAPAGAPQLDLLLQFAHASHVLSPSDKGQLNRLANAMNSAETNKARFTIAGHTDASGDPLFNEKLSCARALSARDHLIGRGVAAHRLEAYGFGNSRPVVAGVTFEARNRRVEFRRAQ